VAGRAYGSPNRRDAVRSDARPLALSIALAACRTNDPAGCIWKSTGHAVSTVSAVTLPTRILVVALAVAAEQKLAQS
jgi:hypothetical protein